MKKVIFEPFSIKGTLRLPSSKSQAHRALICGALAGNSVLRGIDLSDDITATANALRALGAELSYDSAERTFRSGRPLSAPSDAAPDADFAGRACEKNENGAVRGARTEFVNGVSRDARTESGNSVGRDACKESGNSVGRDARKESGNGVSRDACMESGNSVGRDARTKSGNGVSRGADAESGIGAGRGAHAENESDAGRGIHAETKSAVVRGAHADSEKIIDCCESASTLRFLIPLAAALSEDVVFVGHGRLPERTTLPYRETLEKNGARLDYPADGGFLPLRVSGGLRSGEYFIRGDVSSQFVSGLLYAASLISGVSVIKLTTKLESKPYADMTAALLSRFGANVTETSEDRLPVYTVRGGGLHPLEMNVEGDCSQAAFFAVAAAVNGEVTLRGVDRRTLQGDFRLFEIVSRFGAEVAFSDEGVRVSHKELHAADIDAADIPDLVPALAVLAAFSEGRTRIYNAGRLRLKESDRIKSTAGMLRSIGAEASETDDGLIIVGRKTLPGGSVLAAGDHRIAMAAACASAGCAGEVTVDDMSCISKSYPEFLNDLAKVGGKFQPVS